MYRFAPDVGVLGDENAAATLITRTKRLYDEISDGDEDVEELTGPSRSPSSEVVEQVGSQGGCSDSRTTWTTTAFQQQPDT